MTGPCFRCVVVCLLVVLVVEIGLVGFLIWNQQAPQEAFTPADRPGQLNKPNRGPSPPSSEPADEEQSQETPKAKLANPAPSDEKSQKKAESGDTKDTKTIKDEKDTGDDKGSRATGARTYQVDAKASRIYVKVGSATRIGHPHGVEGSVKSGKITMGAGGELVFDMTSFKADSKQAREKVGLGGKKVSENEAKKVQETMLSPEILDVKKFPTASFKIIAINPAEKQEAGMPGTYDVNGRFSLHGVEQPLQFQAELEVAGKDGGAKLSGSFVIKQTDYGITPYSVGGGLIKVADRLDILGEIVLKPAK